jgi:hypothetical protein
MCLGETAGSGLITSGRWLIYRCESTYDFVNLFHFFVAPAPVFALKC